ncbi:hypothetical protein HYV70_05360 [Candidatus Uhrbacteria bacterium]|nr:hypothetical protein [Candidatus Uhrbacteria bacterium]
MLEQRRATPKKSFYHDTEAMPPRPKKETMLGRLFRELRLPTETHDRRSITEAVVSQRRGLRGELSGLLEAAKIISDITQRPEIPAQLESTVRQAAGLQMELNPGLESDKSTELIQGRIGLAEPTSEPLFVQESLPLSEYDRLESLYSRASTEDERKKVIISLIEQSKNETKEGRCAMAVLLQISRDYLTSDAQMSELIADAVLIQTSHNRKEMTLLVRNLLEIKLPRTQQHKEELIEKELTNEEQTLALELANDVLALRTGIKSKDKKHKREFEDRLWSLERSFRKQAQKSSDGRKANTSEFSWVRGYEAYKLYSTMLSEIKNEKTLQKFQLDAKATSDTLPSHALKAALRAALNDLRAGKIINNNPIRKEQIDEWDESLSDTTALTQQFLDSLPKPEPMPHLQDLDETPELTKDELEQLANKGDILREKGDDTLLPNLTFSWSYEEPSFSSENDEFKTNDETYREDDSSDLEKTLDLAEVTSTREKPLLTKQERTRARRKKFLETPQDQELPDLGFPADIVNPETTERTLEPTSDSWTFEEPQISLEDRREEELEPDQEEELFNKPEQIPSRKKRSPQDQNKEFLDLGFPKELEEIEESVKTRRDEKKKNTIQTMSDLKNQLLSFDRQIEKLKQEERNTRFFKGGVRKRLERTRMARELINAKHEELLKEQGEEPTETSLEKIETQLFEQREDIARLQSIYDKAWFGRSEKLRQLEQAKTHRTELLKRRNQLRKELGQEIEIETSDISITESSPETKWETLLENIKTELNHKRREILQLKSVYDKAWFGRETKRKQFEETKNDFIRYARKLKETHKDKKNKELNDYLDAVEKALFDEWKE